MPLEFSCKVVVGKMDEIKTRDHCGRSHLVSRRGDGFIRCGGGFDDVGSSIRAVVVAVIARKSQAGMDAPFAGGDEVEDFADFRKVGDRFDNRLHREDVVRCWPRQRKTPRMAWLDSRLMPDRLQPIAL